MKGHIALAIAAIVGCSRSSPPSPTATSASTVTVPARINVVASGKPYGLKIDGDVISFCDERGGRRIGATGHDEPVTRECVAPAPANGACSDLGLDVEVSTPGDGTDRVYVHGSFYPLSGRVHDCARDGAVLAIVTGMGVVTIDTAADRQDVVDSGSGDFVAIRSRWVAWTDATGIHAQRRR